MATAKQLPSGSWRVRVYDSALKKQVSFTSTLEGRAGKAEAEKMAAEYLLNQRQKKETGPTIVECFDRYIESKSNILSPSTLCLYHQIYKYISEIHDYSITDITSEDIQKTINNLSARLSAKTINTIISVVMSVLKVYAPDRRFNVSGPPVHKKQKTILSAEEVLKAIVGTDIELPCLLAMWCSFRKSEVRGIKKSDVKDGVLYINKVKIEVSGQDIEKNVTKTYESTRSIALPKIILDLIDQLPEDQEYITTLSAHDLWWKLDAALKKHNLPHMSFHDLRHLNASVMALLQIPDKYAMERGGWSTDAVMKQIYQHTFTDERKAADKKIDNYFNSVYKKVKGQK